MKKFALIFSLAALMLACTGKKGTEYRISGIIKGGDAPMVYLQKMDTTGWVTFDSATVKDHSFGFRGKLASPDRCNLLLKGRDGLYPFFIENSEINLTVHADSAGMIDVTGSAGQDLFKKYAVSTDSVQILIGALDPQYVKADSLKDSAAMKKLDEQYTFYDRELKKLIVGIAKHHPDSPAGPWLVMRNSYRFELPELDSIRAGLDTSLSSSFYYKAIEKRVAILKRVQVGQPAMDFSMNDTTGRPLTLSSLKGKVLLVDFWASWCGPCRAENPNVVRAWNGFHNKGFDVLGVSFDKKKEKWEKAINDDNLTWNHVSDLQYWGNSAGKLYGINSIPANVLLDANQKIIGRNLRGDALVAKLTELLGPPEQTRVKKITKLK